MSFVRAAVNFAASAALFGTGYYVGRRRGELQAQVDAMLGHHGLQMKAYRELLDQFEEVVDLPADVFALVKDDVQKVRDSFKNYLDSIDFTGSTKRLHDATSREVKKLVLHITDLKKGRNDK